MVFNFLKHYFSKSLFKLTKMMIALYTSNILKEVIISIEKIKQ